MQLHTHTRGPNYHEQRTANALLTSTQSRQRPRGPRAQCAPPGARQRINNKRRVVCARYCTQREASGCPRSWEKRARRESWGKTCKRSRKQTSVSFLRFQVGWRCRRFLRGRGAARLRRRHGNPSRPANRRSKRHRLQRDDRDGRERDPDAARLDWLLGLAARPVQARQGRLKVPRRHVQRDIKGVGARGQGPRTPNPSLRTLSPCLQTLNPRKGEKEKNSFQFRPNLRVSYTALAHPVQPPRGSEAAQWLRAAPLGDERETHFPVENDLQAWRSLAPSGRSGAVGANPASPPASQPASQA